MVGVDSVSKVHDLTTAGQLPGFPVPGMNCFLLSGSSIQLNSSRLLPTCEYFLLLVLSVLHRWCDWVGILIASLPLQLLHSVFWYHEKINPRKGTFRLDPAEITGILKSGVFSKRDVPRSSEGRHLDYSDYQRRKRIQNRKAC